MRIMTHAPAGFSDTGNGMMAGDVSIYSRTELDILLLNIEAAVRITRRTEFFSWMQGVFQGVIAHEVLICGLAFPNMNGLKFEWLGSYPLAAERFTEMCSMDRGLMYRAIKLWHERGGTPLLLNPRRSDVADDDAELSDLLQRWGLKNLVAHGLQGLDGRPAGFFALCKVHGVPAEREARLIAMVLPYLYAAWMRANCDASAEAHQPERGPQLTPREIEILGWMQKGKSNGEIGQILSISQLTVKNHVQKILRKLGAHNRTQAVAKGITLSITRGGIGHLA
jgi:transcriptional regulator EpsA